MSVRVGVDLDGVLYDFGASVRLYLDSIGRHYGWKDDAAEPHDWNFFEYWGMDRNEFRKICDDGVDAGYIFSGDIRPHAKEAVNDIAEAGHEIIIITDRQFGSRPVNSHAATRNWLDMHGIWFDELVFSADKTCVPTDTFVEDKLENYDALVANGTKCFLINRPWNLVPGGDARERIADIWDYAVAVSDMTEKGFADLSFS